ncbi:hypothetical protein H4R20_004477 [Coemansia guatemalensis]|uniref:Uncharacterized protein n=1 Tax=Coemansia guatemalensis TaxID=2761395 RepID=A0A9W8HRN2_9FUNG|nr:hypothetical protein H4R20_004477 [Coemansia guatemalensis]
MVKAGHRHQAAMQALGLEVLRCIHPKAPVLAGMVSRVHLQVQAMLNKVLLLRELAMANKDHNTAVRRGHQVLVDMVNRGRRVEAAMRPVYTG